MENTDLSGGLNPAFEYFLAERPDNPDMRDSATMWIMDQGGKIAFPRVTFDAIGESWDTPWVQLNYADASGRTLRVWSEKPGDVGLDGNGRATVRTAGPLRFECVEPFRRWVMEFDGTARESTVAEQMAGHETGLPVDLSFRFEAEMAAPPWLMGGLTDEAREKMKSGDASALMGGVRYEQLGRVTGFARIDGEEHRIEGTVMRVRRQGVRQMGAALGHVQHSALFPSGRAFGAIAFAPGPDGKSVFNEAFLYVDGRQVPARIAEASWMTRLVEKGDDCSVVLESELGNVRIEGETLLSPYDHNLFEMADCSVLTSGTARYVWDGEETVGLVERCTLHDKLEGYEE